MEEKIADGIYITRKGQNKKVDEKNIKDSNFVYSNAGEYITLLESQLEEYFKQTKDLFEANEAMWKFDPKDYDLIDAREENLLVINKNMKRMQEIQEELKKLCPTNPLSKINLWDFQGENLNKENKKEELTTDNIVSAKVTDSIITEIEL